MEAWPRPRSGNERYPQAKSVPSPVADRGRRDRPEESIWSRRATAFLTMPGPGQQCTKIVCSECSAAILKRWPTSSIRVGPVLRGCGACGGWRFQRKATTDSICAIFHHQPFVAPPRPHAPEHVTGEANIVTQHGRNDARPNDNQRFAKIRKQSEIQTASRRTKNASRIPNTKAIKKKQHEKNRNILENSAAHPLCAACPAWLPAKNNAK